MNSVFRELFRLQSRHGYADERATGVEYVVPAPTRELLRRGRMQARAREGRLHVLMETSANGDPRVALAVGALRFGVRPRVPGAFANVTAPLHAGPNTPLLRSSGAPNALAPATDVRVVAHMPRHSLTSSERPVAVSLTNADGALVSRQVVPDPTSEVTLDLRGQPAGHYRLRCEDRVEVFEQDWLLEPELSACCAVLELPLEPALYARESQFTLSLSARSERLRYYVVARRPGSTDLSTVTVEDLGHLEDARPQVGFARVDQANFGSDHLPPASLDQGGGVVLCESIAAVPRTHPGRRRIQLSLQGEVRISNLPAAGADRSAADIVIHL